MAILTKSQLTTANSSSFPDNNSQLITPQVLRDFNQSVIDTLVDSLDTGSFANTGITNGFTQQNNFTSISASSFVSASNFVGDGSKLTNITASVSLPILDEGVLQGYATSMNFTGSAISASVIAGTAVVNVNIEGAGFVTTASFNSFTASTNQFTQSASSSISQLNASSASQQVSINALNVYTGSQSTASIVNSISSLNQFTQSQQTFNSTISAEVTALEIATASINSSITQLNASSASQQISINSINAASSSWITESETGSFVTTNTVQTISATKTFNANIGMSSTTPIVFGGFATNTISSNGGRGLNIFATETDGNNDITIKTGGGNSLPNNTINLVTDGSSTTNRIRLQSSNIIITGSTDINGALTASLQQGYVWVGAGNGKTTTVATSSLVTNVDTSSLVTTSSFNAYTSSNNQRVSSLEAATSSLFTSASLGLTTASFNNGNRNLTFSKGDGTTFSVNIPDVSGSAGNFVTTASFNSYTQSNDQRVGSLENNSASVNTSITNLNSATSSLFTSASLGLTTASISGINLTFTKGDGTQFTLQTATGSVVSASYAETSSITRNVVITARNGNASTLGAGTVVHITGASGDNPIFTTASYDNEALSSNTFGLLRYSSPSGADVEVVVNGVVTGVNTDPALGYAAGDIIYLSSSGQFTKVQPQAPNQIVTLGQVLRAQQNNGSIYVSINNGWELNELHNVQITTSSLATNNLLVYESASYGLWKNKSFAQLGLATTGSNNFIGDQTTTGYFSASAIQAPIGTFATLNAGNGVISSSAQISGLGYATTGSNSFNGNQTITGSVYISSSTTNDLVVEGRIFVSSSATTGTGTPQIVVSGSQGQTTITRTQFTTRNLTYQGTISPIVFDNSVIATADSIGMAVSSSAAGISGWNLGPSIYVNNTPGDTYPAVFGFQNKANYTDGRVAVLTPLSASAGFTASLQNGYAWVGNSLGQNTEVATSSFGTAINTGSFATTASFNSYTQSTDVRLNNIEATTASLNTSVSNLNTATASLFTSASLTLTTASVNLNTITFTKGDGTTFALTVNTGSGGGGAAFPFTGDAVITGSLLVSGSGIPDVKVIGNVHITGSLVGQPITLSVSANTASLNMTAGNNFVLTLPSSSTTHITATNLIAGQTLNLLVKQQVGPATGSITFAPFILFPSGLDMQATATGSAIDLISMISFDTTNLMAANVKNLK